MADAAIDTDVLLKAACYGLSNEIIQCAVHPEGKGHILGAARFTVLSRLKRISLNKDTGVAIAQFNGLLQTVTIVEPTQDETLFAAELEAAALEVNAALDSGESQLAAIVIKREIPILATGDKRAIAALVRLIPKVAVLTALAGRITCLEQLFLLLLNITPQSQARAAVCAEPAIDMSLRLAFECSNTAADKNTGKAGLLSYIASLSEQASGLLTKSGS